MADAARRFRERSTVPGSCATGSAPLFPGPGQLRAAEYFVRYQRAQLMALLSQGVASLAPQPRRAGSRDEAVQVNPRRHASVQCSLGRRTLQPRTRVPGPPGGPRGGSASPRAAGGAPEQDSPPGCTPRPVRISRYSRVTFYRAASLLKRAAAAEGAGLPGVPGSPDAPRGGGPERQGPPAQKHRERGAGPASCERPEGAAGLQALDTEGDVATPRASRTSPEPPPSPGRDEEASGDETEPGNLEQQPRLRFQFLEQKYGFYHCKDCNIRWESAYVWCVQGTNKVYFKQFCRNCQKSYNPYRVEDIICQSCKEMSCSCTIKLRRIDPKRPHRQDLCGRCKGKRVSCDNMFSFKYII